MKNKTEKIAFNFLCDKDIKDKFIDIAHKNDTSASKLFRLWIREYIAKDNFKNVPYKNING